MGGLSYWSYFDSLVRMAARYNECPSSCRCVVKLHLATQNLIKRRPYTTLNGDWENHTALGDRMAVLVMHEVFNMLNI